METIWTKLKNIISTIDWSQFHFLRPKVFYFFIALFVITLLLIAGNRERKKWKHIIQPALRPFMFSKGSTWAIILPLLLFVFASSLVIVGLAGPTWKKIEIPGEKIQAVVLIALDASKSMTATDIEPNRLERAKFKISDLLDANPRAKAGLVVYAGTAHPVLPFTNDYKLIKHQASSIINQIMPTPGSDVETLLQMVDTMMNHVNAPSTVILMTDEISASESTFLTNYFHASRHHLEILLFSTPNGAAVPGYPKILSRQDPSVIQNLSQDTSIHITPLTLDKSDVTAIAKRISEKLIFEKDKKQDAKEWADMGWLLIIPALLTTLFWFRKGWVIQWCMIPLCLLTLSSCGINSKHPDWWYSKDYQGQLLENAGKYEEAAEKFEDDQRKAVSYYKAGNFEAAADLFALDSGATSTYNRGLALAKLGRYDEALDAFNQVTNLDPSMRSVVEKTIRKTSSAKQKADSVTQFDMQSVSKDAKDLKEKKKKDDPLKERKPESDDEKLSSDTRVKKLPTSGNRVTDEAQSNIHRGKEAKTPPKDFEQQQKGQSAEQVLMRQTAADPSEFLHRRFELQVKRYYKNVKKQKDPW